MPAILKDSLLFPYTGGLQLALAAFQGGGYAGVDQLYANPPDTTEQVLHPDKFQADEQAVAVDFPADFPASLGDGWKVALEDTLGEFQLRDLPARRRRGRRLQRRRQGLGRRPRRARRGPGRRRTP